MHNVVELRPIISTCRLKGMNGENSTNRELTESQLIVDKKTATVAAFALVAGMALWAIFQNQMPFQTRTETANQIELIKGRLDSQDQKIGEQRIEITSVADKMSSFAADQSRTALETQKGIDDIKVQLVAIQTRLDMMDSKKGTGR